MNPGGVTWYCLLPCQGHKGNQCQAKTGIQTFCVIVSEALTWYVYFALPEVSYKSIQKEKLR